MDVPPPARILVVRLGALGDIVHALPAVATLKHSFPRAHLTWAVESRWAPLLGDNPFVDRILPLELSRWRFASAWRDLRAERFDVAVDFQGLLKSALAAWIARPERIVGFDYGFVREKLAAFFYSHRAGTGAAHVVDRNLDLAHAAGAVHRLIEFPLPDFPPEDGLPDGDFVLASPAAGWRAKQWPPAHYARLARLLADRAGWPLVIACAPGERAEAQSIVAQAQKGCCLLHVCSVESLVATTRRARAVVGVDSGPLHLAAALERPGVALFGPTDPARNGPYGNSIVPLRSPDAVTSYKRTSTIAPSMWALEPEQVFEALERRLSPNPILEPHR